MNTAELIALLRAADPPGTREVWIEIRLPRDMSATDIATTVSIDEAGDITIEGEGS